MRHGEGVAVVSASCQRSLCKSASKNDGGKNNGSSTNGKGERRAWKEKKVLARNGGENDKYGKYHDLNTF